MFNLTEAKHTVTISTNRIHIVVLVVFLLGAFLRFYSILDMEWTHDELSALNRTSYATFSELVSQGIETDFHPAGVQTFLWYWVQWGQSKLWVRLPFVLLSCASLLLFYLWVRRAASIEHGVLAMGIMSVSEYFIFYGQIARPYGPGLFFGLVAALSLQRILDKPSNSHWWGYAIGMLGLAYTHYYAQFFALILFLLAWFVLAKERRWKFFWVNALILLVYSPHIPLFMRTFSKGGVGGEEGWLGTPDPMFIPDFLQLQFNYSTLGTLLGMLMIAWFILKLKETYRKLIYLFPFFISLGIGWVYSFEVNPILQFSILIFSFPLFLGSLLSTLPKGNYLWVLTGVLLLSGGYSLIESRKYYSLTTQNGYSKGAQLAAKHGVLISFEDPQNWIRHGVVLESIFTEVPNAKSIVRSQNEFLVIDRPSQRDIRDLLCTHAFVLERHKSFAHDFWVFGSKAEGGLVSIQKMSSKPFLAKQWAWDQVNIWPQGVNGFLKYTCVLDSLEDSPLIPYARIETQVEQETNWLGTHSEQDSSFREFYFFVPPYHKEDVSTFSFLENPNHISGVSHTIVQYFWPQNAFYDGILRPFGTRQTLSDYALASP